MQLRIFPAAALLISTGFATPVLAQRICIVDNSDNVVCGRPATDRDLDRYNNSSSGSQRENLYDEINEIYRDMLGQDVGRREFLTWSRAVERGTPLRAVRREIAQRPEVQARINQIYREVLGRDADPDGLKTYTNRLIDGASLRDIRNDIRRSDEARRRNRR